MEGSLLVISYGNLCDAAWQFSPLSCIGEGGFGKVYKGELSRVGVAEHPCWVAIKKSNESPLSRRQLEDELEVLKHIKHERIVSLLGYSSENETPILVYEYMPNSSLDKYLYGGDGLPWITRRKIALHVAEAIAYLHRQNPAIIYRDIKSSNVLLDENFGAKLGDFGLAVRENNGADNYGNPMGTDGYADPDYFTTGKLYKSADVYSFGVLLLELITGQNAYDTSRQDEECFLLNRMTWFLFSASNKVVDSRISIDETELFLLAELIKSCVSVDPKDRPPMDSVVAALNHLVKMDTASSSSSS